MMPSIGDRVLYRIGGPDHDPELRPADVVRVHGTLINVVVLTDGSADLAYPDPRTSPPTEIPLLPEAGDGIACREDVHHGTGIGQWRAR